MIYPENFETKIGFEKIRTILKTGCLSELGKQKVDEMAFSHSYYHIKKSLHETEEFVRILTDEDDFPLNFFYDVRSYLEKIDLEGTYLEISELFQIKRSLETIKSIVYFFKSKDENLYPYLRELSAQVELFPYVIERINLILNKNGQMKDNASPDLQQIRRSLFQKQGSISKRMHELLRQAQNDGWVEKDSDLVVREGKVLIPVAATNKRKIKGFVHDESATGKTVYIEPIELVELNNEIVELQFAERREIINILQEISRDIRPYVSDLQLAYRFLAAIDFIRAKARFALSVDGILPRLVNQPLLNWHGAIHPLLFLSFKTEKKTVVPLNIKIDRWQNILLISGPNAGGKSVCLKTVGLLQYMLQCGLLLPLEKSSKAGIFRQLFIDIGDEQSIENDLSTYSSHLLNMKVFLEKADRRSLVLIDEFGTGTEPLLGGAISEAILENLNEKRVNGVITTHYTNLKHFATASKGIVNGAMLFDNEKMLPRFILRIGKPGSSFAFEIAEKIGLSKAILEKASEKVGKKHIEFDKSLQQIEESRRNIENQSKNLRQKEKKLSQLLADFTAEKENLVRKRRQILKEAQDEAGKILSGINKKIENTIFEIRKSQADKEKTKQLRQKLDEFKVQQTDNQKNKSDKFEKEFDKLRRKVDKMLNKKVSQQREAQAKTAQVPIAAGNKVRLEGQDVIGEVLDVKDGMATVTFGTILSTLKLERLVKISGKQLKQLEKQKAENRQAANWGKSIKSYDFSPNLDVRGKRAEEALRKVTEFIDEAIVVNAHEIRILHGKGDGILRQIIREYLRTVPIVQSAQDEKLSFGGAGITVV